MEKRQQIKPLSSEQRAKRMDFDGKDFFMQVLAPVLAVTTAILVFGLPQLCRGEEYVPATMDARAAFQGCMAELGSPNVFLEAGNAKRFVFKTEDNRHLRIDSVNGLFAETIIPKGSSELMDVTLKTETVHDETAPLLRKAQFCMRKYDSLTGR